MKFLCLCQYGHSRSVAMCRTLHARKHQAIAVGAGTSPDAIPLLAEWADVIIPMETAFTAYVMAWRSKVVVNDVGPDKWVNPYNAELRQLCEEFATLRGW